jgi:hypothetical protein
VELTRTGPRDGAGLLVFALGFTFLCHGAAMLGMVLFLLPGMPGGGVEDVAARAAYVAEYPWRWRLGWLGWQLTALSDLLLGVSLVRTRWIPRLPAWITLLVTLVAVVPDQGGQALWVTIGVDLARDAAWSGNLAPYVRFESWVFPIIAGWGATLYTVGALGWTWCFAAAGVWSRTLTWLSVAVWGIFAVVSPALLLPESLRAPAKVVSAANAIGFALMQLWFALVALRVRKAG